MWLCNGEFSSLVVDGGELRLADEELAEEPVEFRLFKWTFVFDLNWDMLEFDWLEA